MALEHIKTDGTETGLTASEKINNCFIQSDANLNNLTNKLDITGDTMTGNLTIGIDKINAKLELTPLNSDGTDQIVLTDENGSPKATIIVDNTSELFSIQKNNLGAVECELSFNKNGNVSIADGISPLAHQDLTTKIFVEGIKDDLQLQLDDHLIVIDTNTQDIFVLDNKVSTNETAITELISDISDLDTNKVNKSGDTMTGFLKGLNPTADDDFATKGYTDNLNTFDYQKRGSVNDISDTYTTLCDMTTPVREAGTYLVGLMGIYTFDQTNKSAYIRYSFDNGSSWQEFRREPKDNTDSNAFNYFMPLEHTTSEFHIIVQARKEDTNGTLNFQFADVSFASKHNGNHIPYL